MDGLERKRPHPSQLGGSHSKRLKMSVFSKSVQNFNFFPIKGVMGYFPPTIRQAYFVVIEKKQHAEEISLTPYTRCINDVKMKKENIKVLEETMKKSFNNFGM